MASLKLFEYWQTEGAKLTNLTNSLATFPSAQWPRFQDTLQVTPAGGRSPRIQLPLQHLLREYLQWNIFWGRWRRRRLAVRHNLLDWRTLQLDSSGSNGQIWILQTPVHDRVGSTDRNQCASEERVSTGRGSLCLSTTTGAAWELLAKNFEVCLKLFLADLFTLRRKNYSNVPCTKAWGETTLLLWLFQPLAPVSL